MIMLRRIALAVVVVALCCGLGGCAEWSAAKAGVSAHGAQLADETLRVNRWYQCQAASVGSTVRALHSCADLWAWWLLCGQPVLTQAQMQTLCTAPQVVPLIPLAPMAPAPPGSDADRVKYPAL